MNKVMVRLMIPVTGKEYDIVIPVSLSVGEATDLIGSFYRTHGRRVYAGQGRGAVRYGGWAYL